MPESSEQSVFADTKMESQSGEAEVGSYGFLGRYRLDRMIGHGAMGAVFEAFDSTLGRTIAIKTLYTQPDQTDNGFDTATVDAAILQEARTAATLNHPHIVTVYDAGRAPSTMLKRELPYVAMELLQGSDLRHRMNAVPGLSQREAVSLVGKLALALDHAHKGGVLHRDIKPANVFITKTGSPKILDFGLAKFTARAVQAADATAKDVVAGSPQYMSPEMVHSITHSSQVVDARSDVYSLGVILYELLCGKKPFTAPTLELLQERIAHSQPEPPHLVNPAIPRDLSRIMLRALAKKPEDRYRSAGQLARELRRWGAGVEGTDAAHGNTQPNVAAGLSMPAPLATAANGLSVAASKRRAWPWMALAGVLTLGVAAWFTLTPPHTAPAPVSTASTPAATKATNDATPVLAAAPTPAVATPAPAATPIALATPKPSDSETPSDAVPDAAKVSPQPAQPAEGRVRIAVTPWGSVEVDGKNMGVSPPLTALTLAPGDHTIVLRNSDFAARTFRIKVEAGKTERVAHRFE
jgi:eukaryotic-like serine/threonine-protein kinase